MAMDVFTDYNLDIFGEASLANLIRQNIFTVLPTLSGWAASNAGSGSGSQALSYLQVFTGTTASSRGLFYVVARNLGIGAAGWNLVHWDKKIVLVFALSRVSSDAEAIARVQIKNANTEGVLADKGIGLQIDNLALTGESYGSERGTVDLATTLTNSTPVQVVIVHTPGVSVEFFVNCVSKGKITTAAAIPDGEQTAYYVVSIINGVTGGVDANLNLSNIVVWQGL